MNETVKKLLLSGDKFMPEMHLKQPGFTYSACEPFTKNLEHCVKSVQIRSSFLSVFSRIQTRKNSVFGHLSRSEKHIKI